MVELHPAPLTAEAFAPFGQVLQASGAPDKWINTGNCARFHDLAQLEVTDGRAGISLFQAWLQPLPYSFDLVERHPAGSQAFLPMCQNGFLVIVAPDDGGVPGTPLAFETAPGQGINLNAGTWHGVLTPLAGSGLFAVVDRIGPGANLEEYRYPAPYRVTAA